MAEVVQGILEDMSADLLDLQSREVFSPEEIKEIISTRRSHEYKLARNKPSKKHYFSAIHYELSLESLRLDRKQELSAKPSSSDKSIVRRIQSLFRRFSKLYKFDVSVWKEYISFCVRCNLKRELSHVLAKCLQLHSRCEDIWIISFCVELNLFKNIESSRNVLIRGIELNPKSQVLWTEYFEFEAAHSQGTDAVVVVFKHAVKEIPALSKSLIALGEKLDIPKDLLNQMKKLANNNRED